jgi:hypothetical protein
VPIAVFSVFVNVLDEGLMMAESAKTCCLFYLALCVVLWLILQNISAYWKTLITHICSRWLTTKCTPHSSTAVWWVFLIPCHVYVQGLQSCECGCTCWCSFNNANMFVMELSLNSSSLASPQWWHSCCKIIILFGFNAVLLLYPVDHIAGFEFLCSKLW